MKHNLSSAHSKKNSTNNTSLSPQQWVQLKSRSVPHKFILAFHTHYLTLRLIENVNDCKSQSVSSEQHCTLSWLEYILTVHELFYIWWDRALSLLWHVCPLDVCVHTHGFMCVYVCMCVVCVRPFVVPRQVPRWDPQQEFTASRQLL